MSSLNWLLVTGLEHVYGAHQQAAKQAEANVGTATYPKLKAAAEMGLELDRVQLKRLEKVFKALKREPCARPDAGMEGILEANQTLLAGTLDPVQRDLIQIALAQTVAHFYLAKYGELRAYAEQRGEGKAARLLGKTLKEIKQADRELTALALELMDSRDAAGEKQGGGSGTMLALLLGMGAAFLAFGISQAD